MTFSKTTEFTTKEDLLAWIATMLPKDCDYLQQSGGAYLAEIRDLEALLRPLWALIPKHHQQLSGLLEESVFCQLLQLINQRQLPTITTANRQIAVELGVVGYALISFGNDFLQLIPRKDRSYFLDWLASINQIEFPAGNWYFFLVLVNVGLQQVGADFSQERLDFALAGIDSFYLGAGWYSDGDNQQRDYYVSFAFHFYGLLVSRVQQAPWSTKFRQRAVLFAEDFIYWFDPAGRSLPFGRSLTYRFAHVSFWAALVITGAYQETNLSLSEIKGIILRNLHFWQQQPITLPKEGNLSIGYGYNNLVLSEDYNAPASPMWAFKACILLEEPFDSDFWSVSEAEMPQKLNTKLQAAAGFHLQTLSTQTIALSSLQCAANPLMYHHVEKYSKLAYSTYFGFNLTRDNQHIENFAIDSALAFSLPGSQQWQTRGKIDRYDLSETIGISCWQLWQQIKVVTYLVPLINGAHLRIHEIMTPFDVVTMEGGFPLFNWNKKYDTPLYQKDICRLENAHGFSQIQNLLGDRETTVIPQGPNSNIYNYEKNAIPCLGGYLTKGRHLLASIVHADPQMVSTPTIRLVVEPSNFFLTISDKAQLTVKRRDFDD